MVRHPWNTRVLIHARTVLLGSRTTGSGDARHARERSCAAGSNHGTGGIILGGAVLAVK